MPDTGSALLAYWKWAAIAVATISAAFGFGVARSKVAMKSELYNKDGSQIYVPKSEFKEIADKVNEMNYTLGRIDQFMKDRIK